MSDQFDSLAIRLTITHSSPSGDEDDFAQPQDKTFHPADSDKIFMGRSPSNDLPLNYAAISGRHACISREGEEFFLQDLDSRNGTILNGSRLSSQEKKLLRSGDHIRIVPYDIHFFSGMEVYNQLPPTENTAMIRNDMLKHILGGVMGPEDTPPKLIVLSVDGGETQQFKLASMHSEFRIGRSPQCDLIIHDENLSREHAMVRRDPSGVMVRDLNSRNGVLVNGQHLPRNVEKALQDRDEITLGSIKILFSDPRGADIAEKVGEVVEEQLVLSELGPGRSPIPRPQAPPPNIPPSPPNNGEENPDNPGGENPDNPGGENPDNPDGENPGSSPGLTGAQIAIIMTVFILFVLVIAFVFIR